MEKKISTNQLSLLLVVFIIALKLSVLPAVMNDYSGRSSYITCLIAVVIDFLCTLVVLSIIMKIPEESFFSLLKKTLSKPVAIIVYLLMFFYFFSKMIIALTEIHDYYTSSLFEELNPYFGLLVLFCLLLFLLSKNFRTHGRLVEVFFWPMVIGISFTLIFPFSDIELTNLLPLFKDGLYPIGQGLFHTTLAFGDFMLLFVLMGKIKYSDKAKKKIIIYVTNALLFIFNFYVVFVGAFGDTSVNQTLALGELPLHNPHPATINRLEWLTIIIWTALMLINSGILGKCCCDCFKNIFGISDNKLPSIVVTILAIVIESLSMFRINVVARVGTSTLASIIAIVIYSICIALLIIGYLRLKGTKKDRFVGTKKVDIRTNTSRRRKDAKPIQNPN